MIAYTRLVSGDGLSEVRLMVCSSFDCSASAVIVLASGVAQGYRPSLALQANGFPMVSFSRSTGLALGSSVSAVFCNDAQCSTFSTKTDFLPADANSPGWTSIALLGGEPVVAFVANRGSSSALYYWLRNSTSSPKIIFSQPSANLFQWGSDRNMAVVRSPTAGESAIVAVYVDGVGLVLVICSGASCVIAQQPVVDAAAFNRDVGLYPSVAVDPASQLAVVAYHDTTNLQLKMVLCKNVLCTNRVVKQFPSTYGWDPSLIIDHRNGFPLVAFSDPSSSDVSLLACSDKNCDNITFTGLVANVLPRRRFESVKLLSSLPYIVAHDTFSSEMVAIFIPTATTVCGNTTCNVVVTITSPVSSPFATRQPSILVTGTVSVFGPGVPLQILLNNGTALTLDPLTGFFSGTVPLVTGNNVLVVSAVNSTTGQQVGAATVIVVSDSQGATIRITTPATNGTTTVAASISVEGTASATTGVASVSVLNVQTGVRVDSNTTSPAWSVIVMLQPSTTNTLTATATDNLGNSVSQTVTVVQSGLTPQLTCPQSFRLECGSLIPELSVRLLNCNEPVVQATDAITPTCGSSRVVTRSFSACSASCSYTISIVDTVAPVVACPPDVTVDCGSALPVAVATDACSVSPSLSASPVLVACGATGVPRTFSATDGCQTSSCTHRVTVRSAPDTTTTASTSAITTITTTPEAGLSSGAIGGLVAGLVLLLLILLLAFLIALCWLRRRKQARSNLATPMMMMGDFEDEASSTSVSSVTRSKLYKAPQHADDSSDLRDVLGPEN